MLLLSFFLWAGTTLAILHSKGKIPSFIQETNILCKGLQISLSHDFIIQVLILSWPWALFGSNDHMIFNMSSSEKYIVDRDLSVIEKMQVDRVLLSSIKEHCWAKKVLNNLLFSLIPVMVKLSLWMIRWIQGIFFPLRKLLRIDQ